MPKISRQELGNSFKADVDNFDYQINDETAKSLTVNGYSKSDENGILQIDKIYGKTLCNIVRDGNKFSISDSKTTAWIVGKMSYIKPNTTYTACIFGNPSNAINMYIGNNTATSILIPNQKLKNVINFTTSNDIDTSLNYKLYLYSTNASFVDYNFRNTHFMVFEGNYTENELYALIDGTYFEGLKSVISKINIVSCGKNLCDGKFEMGSIVDGTNTNSNIDRRSINYHIVKPNVELSLSGTSRYTGLPTALVFYDVNENYISTHELVGTGGKVTSPYNARYARIRFGNNMPDLVPEVQLEESTQSTTFEPYKDDKRDILSPIELNEWDVFDNIINKLYKNTITTLLNGNINETWSLGNAGDLSVDVERFYISVNNGKKTGLICDRFKIENGWDKNIECASLGDVFNIYILKSNLKGYSSNMSNTDKVNLFKKWLQENPTTIQYEAGEPEIIPISNKRNYLRKFKGGHIFVDSEVTPRLECTAYSSMIETLGKNSSETGYNRDRIDEIIDYNENYKGHTHPDYFDEKFSQVVYSDQVNHHNIQKGGLAKINSISGSSNIMRNYCYPEIKNIKLGKSSVGGINDRMCSTIYGLAKNTLYTIIVFTKSSNCDLMLVHAKDNNEATEYRTIGISSELPTIRKTLINTGNVKYIQPYMVTEIYEAGNFFDIGAIMILEGDWTDKPIPPYISPNDFAYTKNPKIISVGKNILPDDHFIGCEMFSSNMTVIDKNVIKITNTHASNNGYTNTALTWVNATWMNNSFKRHYIRVNPGQRYRFSRLITNATNVSVATSDYLTCMDSLGYNMKTINCTSTITKTSTVLVKNMVTVPDNCYYIMVRIGVATPMQELTFSKLMIETIVDDNTEIEYEDYLKDEIQINGANLLTIDDTDMVLSNGDFINKNAEISLTGNETIELVGMNTNTINYRIAPSTITPVSKSFKCVLLSYYHKLLEQVSSNDIECYSIGVTNKGYIFIRFNRSRLGVSSSEQNNTVLLNKLRDYLRSNNLRMIIPIDGSVTKIKQFNNTIRLFKNGTLYLNDDNNVPYTVNMSLPESFESQDSFSPDAYAKKGHNHDDIYPQLDHKHDNYLDKNNGGVVTGRTDIQQLVITDNKSTDHDDIFIPAPKGAYYSHLNSSNKTTGYLMISLPTTWTSTMIGFELIIDNYLANTSVKYLIYGYDYGASSSWNHSSAICIGNKTSPLSGLTVRFGYDPNANKCCIFIGESTTDWSLLHAKVINFRARNHANNIDLNVFAAGWDIKLVSSTSLTTGTVTDTLPKSSLALQSENSDKLGNKPASDYSLTTHNHDIVYSKLNHGHSNYLDKTTGGVVEGLTDLKEFGMFDKDSANISSLFIPSPKGACLSYGNGNLDGFMKITLPVSWTDAMMGFELCIDNYVSYSTAKYFIYGYNYSANASWQNCSATSLGSQHTNSLAGLPVRFGHDGTKCCIYIGNETTRWTYVHARIVNFRARHSSVSLDKFSSGWKIEVVKSVTGTIHHHLTDTLPKASLALQSDNSTKLQNKVPSDFAPSGYGLGEQTINNTNIDSNTITKSGFYQSNKNMTDGTQHSVLASILNNESGFQITKNGTDMYAKCKAGGSWSNWNRLLDKRDYDSLSRTTIDTRMGYTLGNFDWSRFIRPITHSASTTVYSSSEQGMLLTDAGGGRFVIELPVPIDPDASYYIKVTYKILSGNGGSYWGVDTLDQNLNSLKTDNAKDYNYFVASNTVEINKTKTFERVFSGYNGTSESYSNKFDPYGQYFNLIFIPNNSSTTTNNRSVIKSVEVTRIPKYTQDFLKYVSYGTESLSGSDRINIDGYLYTTRTYSSFYNDYAEYFEKKSIIEPGDVVELDINEEDEVYKKSSPYSEFAVGVCSDDYAQCIGGNGDGKDNENFAPIALAGRVKVKTIGRINKGEYLTPSNIEGVAQKYEGKGIIIGRAVENKDTDDISRVRMIVQVK